MDYRNLPFKFGYGGLNILAAPENLAEGQYTRFQNVRYRRDGTLEARPGTEDFTLLMDQVFISSHQGYYPDAWDLLDMRRAAYIGKVKTFYDESVYVDAWLTYHDIPDWPGRDGNVSGFRVFLNGMPLRVYDESFACNNFNKEAFDPVGYSVVRTYAKSGQPIVILDGTHYLVPSLINLYSGGNQFVIDNYTTKYLVAGIPAAPVYKLSITKPPTPTGTCTTGSGALTADGVYQWGITYYKTLTQFESELSEMSGTSTASGSNDTGSVTVITYTYDPQIDKIRIWRKGGTLSSWRLVDTIVNLPCSGGSTTSYTDNFSDQDISTNETIDTNWKTQFTTIASTGETLTEQKFNYAFGPFLGKYIFWVGDPVKKGHIYWSLSGDASRYDYINGVTSVTDAAEELQNGFIFGSLPFVFSRLNLYGLDYGGPDATPQFTPRLIPIGLGLAGKWAFAVGPNAVFFLGRDGIYATDCSQGSATSLTETTIKPIFQGISRGDLAAVDWDEVDTFRMAATAKELHFFYTGIDSSKYHLVYDFERSAWSNWGTDTYTSGYADEGSPTTRMLFGALESPAVRSLDDARPEEGTETFDVVARTGTVDNDIPLTFKEYGVLQLDADLDQTPITITPYYNSEMTAGSDISLTADDPESPSRRDYPVSLGDTYGRSISLQFAWEDSPVSHPVLYQGNILFRDEEERVIHWEMPPATLGQNGWYHLKDGYIVIRSTDTVTLTLIIDGTITDTYLIASTGGEKLAKYIEFKPRRGRVFQFKLDSKNPPTDNSNNPKPFRFYGEESMVRGKPWITGATYQPIQPFGPVGYAQYRRTEGGT